MALFWSVRLLAGLSVVGSQSSTPQWQRSMDICRQLRSDGWKPADPLGRDAAGNGEVRTGGALDIQLCRVVRTLPATGRGRPAQVGLFLQHRGGDAMTTTVRFFDEADRRVALDAGAAALTRVLRELKLPPPDALDEAVRSGRDWSDEVAGWRFRVSTTTRQSELVSQPDLKPEAVPLLTVEISIGAADEGDAERDVVN